MPQGQRDEAQCLFLHRLVLQALKHMDGKEQVRNALVHLEGVATALQAEHAGEERREDLRPLRKAIPRRHVLTELLVDHDKYGQDVRIAGGLRVKVGPEVVLQVLADLQQHNALQLGRLR